MNDLPERLRDATRLSVYDSSIVTAEDGVTYFLARDGLNKCIGSIQQGAVTGEPRGELGGQPVLVVNTASFCGFTHQYRDMQALYDEFGDDGLVVSAEGGDSCGLAVL